MLQVWKEPIASYSGKFVRFQGATIFPKPARQPHPLILMGGNSLRAMKLAAELCDGWIPHFMAPDEYAAKARHMNELLARYLRPSADFQFAFQGFTCVDKNQATAEKLFFSTLGSGSMEFALGKTAEGSPANLSKMGMVGTPEKITMKVEEFVAAGATRYDAFFTYPNIESFVQQIRLFATEVIPSFASR